MRKPESRSCSTSGVGSSPYLSCVLFKVMSGAQIINVPFKGGTQAIQSVIGGQSTMFFANEALPYISAGQVRVLGVTTPKRSSYLPDVPAIGETLPGYDVTRSEEHTSELQSLMRISYAVFCLKNKK